MSDARLTDRQIERIESLLERFSEDRLSRIELIVDRFDSRRVDEIEKLLDASRSVRILWLVLAVLLGPFMLAKMAGWTTTFFEFLGKK